MGKATAKHTYISLFSGAGVGCYGFSQEGFLCVATNELIARRLEIQKYNHKCKYESGYICGDITLDETKAALFSQIELWKSKERMDRVDVVIATPPCQGMSVANHKKSTTEITRNSLVVESIKIVQRVQPRFFVFENVPAFMKTLCTDMDGVDKPIAEAIERSLGKRYSYVSRVINFKNYGASSSRQRTVVIGVARDYADEVSPYELYPAFQAERTLREVIGDLKPLKKFGEIDASDLYHSFRPYPEHMRNWIAELAEGQSAFENAEDGKKPHQIVDGKLVLNQRKNGDKYRRQYWDKVGPCIHTRNDQLASQNTIHPSDDRVFSIRELMRMMAIPDSFLWSARDGETLNALSTEEKRGFLQKEEIKIRQCLGEAVPTGIFRAVARNMSEALMHKPLTNAAIKRIVKEHPFADIDGLTAFIENNPLGLSTAALSKVAELSNARRTADAAYFTNKSLITEMLKRLPVIEKETVRILEPSAGVGNFIPLLLKKFESKRLLLDLVDIDPGSMRVLQALLRKYQLPQTCVIRFLTDDFLLHAFETRYDYVIGNPPFFKMKRGSKQLKQYQRGAVHATTPNLCSFFLEKSLRIADYIAMVFPKVLLNTPEFSETRAFLAQKAVECILDFGENGFPGVLVETIAVFINQNARPRDTRVVSATRGLALTQKQEYIFDPRLPYWVLFRNTAFDRVCKKLDFNVFTAFRDRQLTNAKLSGGGGIRVLKSRNISDDGTEILDIPGYDAYVANDAAKPLAVYAFLDRDDVFLTPNMTYYPRAMQKPKGVLVNGSVAILIPKDGVCPTDAQLAYYSGAEYRAFYQIARNYQTRSLNVDACAVFWYGLLRETEKEAPITERHE